MQRTRRWATSAILPRCYLPLLLLITLGYCFVSITASIDFWAHAAVGRWIVQQGQIPHRSLFLWSSDIPWVWHSWLSQVIFYQLLAHASENIGGLLAKIMTTGAVVFSLFFWWKVWRANQDKSEINAPSWPMVLLFLLAIYTAHERFHPRPEIFSAAFLTIILWMLWRGISSWRHLAGIFVLFAFWANLHAGLATALVILWLTALCDLAQDRDWKKARWTVLAALVAMAAVMVNPYGWHYWSALKQVGGTTFSYIDEWKPFWKFPLMNKAVVASTGLCVVAAFAAWLASERRRWSQLAWLLLAAAMFLMARRNAWLIAQVMLAIVATNPRLYSAKKWMVLQGRAHYVLAGFLLFVAVKVQSPQFWQGHFVEATLPRAGAQRLRALAPEHRIFNNYEISSYLEWALAGNPPLAIDLLNAYPSKLMEEYNAINDGSYRTKTLLEKWQCDIVIQPQPALNSNSILLTNWLSVNYPWALVYTDDACMIWKKMPAQQAAPTE